MLPALTDFYDISTGFVTFSRSGGIPSPSRIITGMAEDLLIQDKSLAQKICQALRRR